MSYNKNLYLYNHYGYYVCEKIFVFLLKIFRNQRKFPLLSYKQFEEIREIVRKAFPDYLQQLSQIESEEELLEYCRAFDLAQIYVLLEDDVFLILVNHHNCYELIECASSKGKTRNIYKLISFIAKNFWRKPVISDCRESTSYPLFLALDKGNRIKITDDRVRKRDEETMHYIRCRVNKRNKKPKHYG